MEQEDREQEEREQRCREQEDREQEEREQIQSKVQQVHFETFPFKAKQVLIVMVGYGGARCGCHCNNLGSDLDGHDRSGCDRGGSWGGNRCCGAFDGDRGGGSGGDCGGGRLGGRDGCS